MSNGSAAASLDDAVLDLIGPFVESTDARIRGNAVQALAVLATGTDTRLAGRAEEQLIRALTAGPASIDPEWQRRFRTRALDALRELGPEQRDRVLKKVMRAASGARTTDRNQQAAVSTLLLEAISSDLFRLINWFQLKRLTRPIGAPRFWTVLWAVAWRYALAIAVFPVVAALAPPEFGMDWTAAFDPFTDAFILSALLIFALSLFSFAGRPKLPLVYRVADTVASGLVFGILCIVGTSWLLDPPESFDWHWIQDASRRLGDFSAGSLLALSALGFVVGASIRLIKWLPEGKILDAYRLRPIAVLLITTALCIAASRLGLDARTISAAWLIIAPAAMILAALDVWLERRGPDLYAAKRTPSWHWIPLAAAAIVLFISAASWRSVSSALPSKMSMSALTITLPEDLREGKFEAEGPAFTHVSLTVNQDERYTIYASPSPPKDITLMVKGSNYDKKIDNDGPEQVEEHTDQLGAGKYSVCVHFSNLKIDCDAGTYGVGKVDMVDFASLLIAAKPLVSMDKSESKIKIIISQPKDRPRDLSANKADAPSSRRGVPLPSPAPLR
jgi:hypothetical protein